MITSAPRPVRTPAHRCRHPKALCSRYEFVHRLLFEREVRVWEKPAIERGCHECAAIPGVLVGEILAIARADNLFARIVAKQPSREHHARSMGL